MAGRADLQRRVAAIRDTRRRLYHIGEVVRVTHVRLQPSDLPAGYADDPRNTYALGALDVRIVTAGGEVVAQNLPAKTPAHPIYADGLGELLAQLGADSLFGLERDGVDGYYQVGDAVFVCAPTGVPSERAYVLGQVGERFLAR